MIRYPIKIIVSFITIAILFIGGLLFIWGDKIDNVINGAHESTGLSVVGWLAGALEISRNLSHLSDTSDKINALLNENSELKKQLFDLSSVETENEILRTALDLPSRSRPNPILAGVFASVAGPGSNYLLLNKGSDHGVKLDSGVITEAGILLGRIDEVAAIHSRVVLLTDPSFKVTVVSFESNTSGIAQGAINSGLTMDFVSESDAVSEGQTILTSGSDFLPAGLRVGTVESVELEAGSLFKKVTIAPYIWDILPVRALIISK